MSLRLASSAPQRPNEWPDIVGASQGLQPILSQVENVATTDVPVLILGETGAGKELIARAVHARSRRAEGPLVRVNCGAIPAELIDSELFGHERGSFTGAVAQRRGWFERAHGGTLFLDEIGDLPSAAQVRLLRVLQDGTFERVGGHEMLRADVRVVAATHRDLPSMVRAGQFRQDLWFRVSVFPIHLPPLRERLGDLPDLVAYFTQVVAKRHGFARLTVTATDLQRLAAHDWPGNVRELAAVVERGALLTGGRYLDIEAALQVGAPMSRPAVEHLVAGGSAGRDSGPVPGSPTSLVQAQRRHIEAALAQAGGRIEGPGGAADLLAINPHTLRARMRKMGLDWSRFRP